MAKLITYDLCKQGKNYDGLIKAINQLPSTVKLTESCWLTGSEKTCAEIRDLLRTQIDSDDRLFVATLTGEAAWIGKMLSTIDKIKEILKM